MKKYSISFLSTQTKEPIIDVDVEATSLRTAINKAVRKIEQVKSDWHKKGLSYSKLCGLEVYATKVLT